jgi:beta-lactamase class D
VEGFKPLIPTSTFKILNSLVALDTGAIRDETEVIRWDGVQRSMSPATSSTLFAFWIDPIAKALREFAPPSHAP